MGVCACSGLWGFPADTRRCLSLRVCVYVCVWVCVCVCVKLCCDSGIDVGPLGQRQTLAVPVSAPAGKLPRPVRFGATHNHVTRTTATPTRGRIVSQSVAD